MTLLFRLSCAAYAVAWLWAALRLPDRVPMHFDLGGDVDSWADRTTALVVLALLGGGVGLLLWVVLVRVTRARWGGVNVPHKRWWLASPERRERLRAMLTQDLAGLGSATMLLLTAAILAITVSARAQQPTLPGWFLPLVGAFLVGVLAWTVWAYGSRYRPDPGAAE